tara:strand:+ start:337 stop:720 length:384 start_codon:yes stop_codon:yes gene_type:complete
MSYKNYLKQKPIYQLHNEVESKFIDIMKTNYQNVTISDLNGVLHLLGNDDQLDILIVSFIFALTLYFKKYCDDEMYENIKTIKNYFYFGPLVFGFLIYILTFYISLLIPVIKTEYILLTYLLLMYIQ